MIYKDNKEIITINYGERPIVAVYKGDRLVWQAVRSCFGSGQWVNNRPWINNEAWKNS